MRIAIMSREYPPHTGWGGIATFKYHLAQGLRTIGHDVEVFSLSGDGVSRSQVENGIMVHRVTVHDHAHTERLIRECDNGSLSDIHKCLPHFRYVVNAALSLWRKFDEIHERNRFEVLDAPELFADSMFVSVKRDVPHVIRLYTPHAKFIAEHLHNIDRSLDHEMVAMLERFAMYACDVITSPSNDLAQWVADDLGYRVEDIPIVRDPIDCNIFNPDGPKAFTADDKIKILFVGRLEERKGVHDLVDAIPNVVSQHPNAHFYFLGADTNTGPNGTSVLAELKRRLATTRSSDAVTFISAVPHLEVPNYMRAADICVVPSLYDNSPFTSIEALASGKPVIGTAAGGTPEYVIHEKVGLIVPARDARSLGNAINELAGNKEKRERLGRAAREWAVTEYSRERIAIETIEIYKMAQRKFENNRGHAINMHPRETLISSGDELANSMDLALHELRLRWSLRYRARIAIYKKYVDLLEFGRLFRQRPKLAVANLFKSFVPQPSSAAKPEVAKEKQPANLR